MFQYTHVRTYVYNCIRTCDISIRTYVRIILHVVIDESNSFVFQNIKYVAI